MDCPIFLDEIWGREMLKPKNKLAEKVWGTRYVTFPKQRKLCGLQGRSHRAGEAGLELLGSTREKARALFAQTTTASLSRWETGAAFAEEGKDKVAAEKNCYELGKAKHLPTTSYPGPNSHHLISLGRWLHWRKLRQGKLGLHEEDTAVHLGHPFL